MGIIELLQRIGEDDVAVQFLHECMSNISTKKNGTSSITFLTDAKTATDVALGRGNLGIVVWIDADKVKAAQLASQQGLPIGAG